MVLYGLSYWGGIENTCKQAVGEKEFVSTSYLCQVNQSMIIVSAKEYLKIDPFVLHGEIVAEVNDSTQPCTCGYG